MGASPVKQCYQDLEDSPGARTFPSLPYLAKHDVLVNQMVTYTVGMSYESLKFKGIIHTSNSH